MTVAYGKESFTIIGVVDQARLYDVHADGRPQLLVRADDFIRALSFVVRTTRDPQSLLPDSVRVVRRVDPRNRVGRSAVNAGLRRSDAQRAENQRRVVGAFAIGALLLAAMGLFGWSRAR